MSDALNETNTAMNDVLNNDVLNIVKRNGIEIYQVNSAIMGNHAVHWDALTDNPADDIPLWLEQMIDTAVMPAGLATEEDDQYLLIANDTEVHLSQVLRMDAEKRPSELLTAYPTVNSPYGLTAKIERIIENTDTCEAVLRLARADGTTIYAFDALYAINKDLYDAESDYQVELSGICHTMETFTEDELITITDEDAIRHHRALNDILAKNNGEAPEDLQEQLDNWQPTDEVDTQPVTLNLGKMCAYLFGEHTAQEDEAWCQGEVIGLQTVTNLSKTLNLLDIVVLREEDTQPVVVRMAITPENMPNPLQVGDFIRTNVWIQAKICAKINTDA